MRTLTGWKSVTDDMKSGHGGETWTIGKWKKYKGLIAVCQSGFHASRNPLDALSYIQGNRFFEVETRGRIVESDDKFVASEMRLVAEVKDFKSVCVRLAIFCARRCLKNFEKIYPTDARPRQAIEAAENYLAEPTEANRSAARSAGSAAWSAAKRYFKKVLREGLK